MLYRFFFRDKDNQPLTLSGFKDVKDDSGFDLWSDTTTLFTRVLKGHATAEEEKAAQNRANNIPELIVASGIIHIYFFDFLKQLTTFRRLIMSTAITH
jgi:cholesterol oxidase